MKNLCLSQNERERQKRLRRLVFGCLLLVWTAVCLEAAPSYLPSVITPPAIAREFRGAWVATVGNIDWPSKPGLTSEQQKSELIALLDRALHLKLNAILLQVRPSSDAFYTSTLEPWSEYLTGRMGQPPHPFYDPLRFAVDEAHQRGLELHAWFNPFRVRHLSARSPVSGNHVSVTRSPWVKQYGRTLWLDPGEPVAREYVINVILDVVRRYDIDGVHLDDYFYPYEEEDASGKSIAFPDGSSWKRYQDSGGKLSREDWRRANIDAFMERLYQSIKTEKSHVKFGVSPFGIWRPGYPAQIEGYDAYEKIYADSRKWLLNGWLDYFTPQLYWGIEPAEQSYPALLKWWVEQNVRKRHIWPGNALSRAGRTAEEIVNQVRLTRKQPGASGNVFWSFRSFLQNRGGIAEALAKEVYAQPALVPASYWLDANPPGAPKLLISAEASGATRIQWQPATGEPIWLWVLQTKFGKAWRQDIFPRPQHACLFARDAAPDVVVLTAIDRCGNGSAPIAMEKQPNRSQAAE